MDDCCRIMELLLGAPSAAASVPLTVGFLEIISPVELSVTAVYTVSDLGNASISMDVETVQAKLVK